MQRGFNDLSMYKNLENTKKETNCFKNGNILLSFHTAEMCNLSILDVVEIMKLDYREADVQYQRFLKSIRERGAPRRVPEGLKNVFC